jgi:spectinomycin phosphotransferase/16S rRNA (guanine(1405)-N(7))-methyltransferase
VIAPPADLPEQELESVLVREWGVTATGLSYRAVGFGSHHWEVTGAAGGQWFLTVDELESKRETRDEPLATAFARLSAALATASALRAAGREFVVAPLPTRGGQPVIRMGDRFGVALYPYITGKSFDWGGPRPPEHLRAALGLVVGVHTAPEAVGAIAMADEFAIPYRDELAAALDRPGKAAGHGPYAEPAARLMAGSAAPLRDLLARYDELVLAARDQPDRAVLTHGEPHPGNTMLASGQWLLIDWDTVLRAPPERDLWDLAAEDGSVPGAYAEATGVAPQPALLDLYRIRWDLSDIALYLGRFRRHHSGSPDDQASWEDLRDTVERLSAG